MLGYIVTLHCYVRLLRYRLWSAATLGVPGSKSRRLFSSRGRLSLLNISVAPGKCSFWQVPNLSNDVWYMVIIMQEDVTMWSCVPPGYSGNELMWLENSVQDFGPRELGLRSRYQGWSRISQFQHVQKKMENLNIFRIKSWRLNLKRYTRIFHRRPGLCKYEASCTEVLDCNLESGLSWIYLCEELLRIWNPALPSTMSSVNLFSNGFVVL